MFERWKNLKMGKKRCVENSPAQDVEEEFEYTNYAKHVEKTLCNLEANLHNSDDPEEIASFTLKTACDFYQGDWAGILEIDMELNIWTPYWWYNINSDDKTKYLINEFEFSEFLVRWIDAMKKNYAIIIPSIDMIEKEYPEEYELYQRLQADSIIGVPIKPRPTAFLIVRNPKRYIKRSSMLQMLAFVVLSAVNEKKFIDGIKMTVSPEMIKNEKDIIVNLFGPVEIYTKRGKLNEEILKSPKIWRLIVYMLLHPKKPHPPLEISAALWEEDFLDSDAVGNSIRGLVRRFRQAFELISDYDLIQSTPNGYIINPELNIMTDLQQFDAYWEAVQGATATMRKVELLKKAVLLYKGSVFANAASEHWINNISIHYSLRYVGFINELLKNLAEVKDYYGINKYATQALGVEPGILKAYYWLIWSMYNLGTIEMAKSQLQQARKLLTEEEYDELLKYLKESKEIEESIVSYNKYDTTI